MMKGFSPASSSPPRIFWNSRKRSAAVRSSEESLKTPIDRPKQTSSKREKEEDEEEMEDAPPAETAAEEDDAKAGLSERRRALFEPLDPEGGTRRGRTSNELLLPPPDFDATSYPRGWLVGKKRKLVNVDVVESMRRVAIQEMNRKDREIDGLNVQLEEDARCLEHLQVQLLEERSKRVEAERQNGMLQEQISMLMNMLEETQGAEEQEEEEHEEIVADQN